MSVSRLLNGGITVTFHIETDVEENDWGVPHGTAQDVEVSNCLYAPASSAALTSSSGASLNEEGRDFVTQTKATLLLPKGSMELFAEKGVTSLRHSTVTIPHTELEDVTRKYEVLGDPEPIDSDICPTPWNLRVTLRRIEG